MSPRAVALSVAVLFSVPASLCAADTPKPKDAPGKLIIDQDLSSMQAAHSARALAQRGNCADALDQFDAALRTVEDADLHRERGMCHEQLGHPFPAMDDYRAYLVAKPQGKQADDVRARLARLEGEGAASSSSKEAEEPEPSSKGHASFSASAKADGNSASAEASASSDDKEYEKESKANDTRPYSQIDADEKKSDAAHGSPLRLGSGFAIGPVFGARRWFSDVLGWSEDVAASFRYSFGKVSTVHADAGYMSINGTGTASSMGGFATFLGYEARIGLDPYVTNAILAGAGGGYERPSQGSTGSTFSAFEGRGQLGFRHVFGPSLGLELLLEAGVANFTLVDAPSGTDSVTKGFLGGRTGLVVGF